MERVVSVNLNGRAYQLEEAAYEALRAYLDRARATLADNPDQAEIVADLEQAIADKCGAYMNAHKQVVAGAEMGAILDEMGPVDGAADEGEARAEANRARPPAPAPRRASASTASRRAPGSAASPPAWPPISTSTCRSSESSGSWRRSSPICSPSSSTS